MKSALSNPNWSFRNTLLKARRGSVVRLVGYLVEAVSLESGEFLDTSLSRDDIAKGGFNPIATCELIYVTSAELLST